MYLKGWYTKMMPKPPLSAVFYTPQNMPPGLDGAGLGSDSVLQACLRYGFKPFVANAWGQLEVVDYAGILLPLVLPEVHPHNSYVCSPMGHYVHYARRELELELANERVLKAGLDVLVQGLGAVFERLNFDRVVYVNNWLLSTNLYPDVSLEKLELLHRALCERYPQRAIVFRSLNPVHHPSLMGRLKQLDYQPVFSRQVYLLDPQAGTHKRSSALKKDRRLARQSPYVWQGAEQIAVSDIPRLKHLYTQLYVKKYSPLNPQFTELFFREALQKRWLHLYVLRHRETHHIEAVVGYFKCKGIMTTPIIGYNPELPPQTGLYRLISLFLADEAERQGLLLHRSSGASHFKRLRGNQPVFEHNWVYTRHLPRAQRLPWQTLKTLSRGLIEPLMTHFEL